MRARLIATVVALALAASAYPAFAAGSNSQISVNLDGKFTAKNLLVYQHSGSALYCRAVWGNSFIRLTVLVPMLATTTILTNHGAAGGIDDISQGDYINVEGTLETGSDTLLVDATKITDLSLNREQKSAAGTVAGVNVSAGSFMIADKKLGNITVVVGTSTITKGVRTITISELSRGDKITSVQGTYDFTNKTLSAAGTIVVYQDSAAFKPRNFEGTIEKIEGTALPASVVIAAEGHDYRVYLAATASLMSKNRAPTQLSRFAVGDKVRIYGAIRPANLAEVDATIVRDLNF